jgi:Rho-binding antiterminator
VAISCAFHDELELRALRRQRCRLVTRDDSERRIEFDAVIRDLITEDGREFALLDNGQRLPLERILSIDGIEP